MWKACKFDTDNGIAILTLNRPEQLNALNTDMFDEIIAACDIVNNDENLKVLIITGAGRGFSTGGDISNLATISEPQAAHRIFNHSTKAIKAVYDLKKPVIAAVNGPVAGASLSLMMASDLILSSESAVFGFSFINVAFCPDSGCSHFLVKKVGYHKAFEILVFGKKLGSNEALTLGLVNSVVPNDQIMIRATEWAKQIMSGPGMTIAMDKKLLRMAADNNFERQAEQESSFQVMAWMSEDFKEGTTAFIEKREPIFKGR